VAGISDHPIYLFNQASAFQIKTGSGHQFILKSPVNQKNGLPSDIQNGNKTILL